MGGVTEQNQLEEHHVVVQHLKMPHLRFLGLGDHLAVQVTPVLATREEIHKTMRNSSSKTTHRQTQRDREVTSQMEIL